MSEELKALERLVDGNLNEVNYYRQFCDSTTYIMKDKETIEKALKRLKELEKAFDALSTEDEKAKKLLSKEIEKNRALEIIKKNELLSVYQDNGRYFVIFTGKYGFEHNTNVEIPKEEYDLLKEVLL